MTCDAVCIGDVLIDFSPGGKSESGNPLYEMNEGGGCANIAVAMANCGITTAFIGNVGDDTFGHFLKGKLDGKGVLTDNLILDPENSTTLAFVHLSEDGDRSFSFIRNPGADTCLLESAVDKTLIKHCKLLHFGSIPLTHNPSRSTIYTIAKQTLADGKLVSFDPNLRHLLWDSLEEAKEVLSEGISYCSVLKVSEEELLFLTDIEDIEKSVTYLYEKYHTPIILATLGKKGVYYKWGEDTGYMPTYTNVKTIDTTGAGDCFIGCFMAQLYKIGMDRLDHDSLRYAINFANAAASLTTTKKGGVPAIPTEEEVLGLINGNNTAFSVD